MEGGGGDKYNPQIAAPIDSRCKNYILKILTLNKEGVHKCRATG